VKSDLGTRALQERVQTLRRGLDQLGEWRWSKDRNRWLAQGPVCGRLWPDGLADEEPLPFRLDLAHGLYQALFGSIEDLIRGKHLFIVPSGTLQSLPFQVLVTEKPAAARPLTNAGYRQAKWLAQGHAITVLPSAASLKALRSSWKKGAPASEPYIGFGDPVLIGNEDCPAGVKVTCPI